MLEVELLGDELILLKKFNDPPLIIQIVNVYCRNFGKVRPDDTDFGTNTRSYENK